jgi:putative oxidoreductase
MKMFLKVSDNRSSTDIGILIARITIGLMMLSHGLPKMMMLFSGGPVQFVPVFGMSATFSLGLAVFGEVFCSILLIIGLGTRLAAIPLVIVMLVALIAVLPNDFTKQEPAVHYLLVYVVLLLTGAGKYSLDYLLQQKHATKYESLNNTDKVAA